MKYPQIIIATLFTVSLQVQAKEENHVAGPQPNAHHKTLPHWDYSNSAHWGTLSEEFATCNQGKAQSPIDITSSIPSKLPPLEFDYQTIPLTIENNGHTIKVIADNGGTLKIGADSYQLKQFHVHSPSEEAINGKKSDMVAHLVHQSKAGQLAVIAVLFEKGTSANPVIEVIAPVIPKEEGPPQKHEAIQINIADLLPKDKKYFTYQGSLTTPPCSEGVKWIVLKTPVAITEKALSQITALYPENIRPLQPLNGRKVLSSD